MLGVLPYLLPSGAHIVGSRENQRHDTVTLYIESLYIDPHVELKLVVEDAPLMRKITLVPKT